ncbi:CyP450 monooxygenase [Irpex rosettiformis]|uniref:CyP450 monooxygenase n=1 Tax=Irpex rosettiformis TaxID=378272 RepID=A0ACB8UDQ4_9APHY|nr:CyP450 monooxygenase [Irpex rosettiformis]
MATLSSPILPTVAALVAVVLLARRQKWANRLRGCSLPPGPRGFPIIGNLLDFPPNKAWVTFREWSQTYGNIMFIQVMDTPILLVSSPEICHDLMEKRSAIYSDKLAFPIDELTGWDFGLPVVPYGQRWRGIRAYFHQYFNNSVTPKYHEKQTAQVHAFLRRCLEHSGEQLDPLCVRLTLAAVVLDIVYGQEVRSMDDEYIALTVASIEAFNETKTLGKFWVDFMPFLKYLPTWLPGAAAVKYGAQWRPVTEEMLDRPFRAIQSGENQNPSMLQDILMNLKEEQDSEHRTIQEQYAKHATGVAYAGKYPSTLLWAAADTTYSLLQTFFCTMAMSPQIRKKAQEELELVVGPERLPTFADQEDLHYLHAIFLECMRWLPVTPLGIAHRLITDDYYNGYFIPKGTVIMPCVWQMLRDPNSYPDPERFNPDRFMKDGVINPDVPDPSDLAFGFGRRHFAKDNAFLTMATALHVFDILPSLNEHGNELDPTPQMTTNGGLCYPDRLHYMLKPRSEAAEMLIRATATA